MDEFPENFRTAFDPPPGRQASLSSIWAAIFTFFAAAGLDQCACKEPLVPSILIKCSNRSFIYTEWLILIKFWSDLTSKIQRPNNYKTLPSFQTLEDFIISILPPIIGDLDSTRVVVEVFPFSQLMQDSVHKLALFDNVVNFCSTEITFSVSFIQPSVLCTFFLE